MGEYKVGTIIQDVNRIGVIKDIVERGSVPSTYAIIRWRINYEIYYSDGVVVYMGVDSLQRLVESGNIKILYSAS